MSLIAVYATPREVSIVTDSLACTPEAEASHVACKHVVLHAQRLIVAVRGVEELLWRCIAVLNSADASGIDAALADDALALRAVMRGASAPAFGASNIIAAGWSTARKCMRLGALDGETFVEYSLPDLICAPVEIPFVNAMHKLAAAGGRMPKINTSTLLNISKQQYTYAAATHGPNTAGGEGWLTVMSADRSETRRVFRHPNG